MPGDYLADLALVDGQIDELEKIALSAGAGRAIGGLLGAGVGGAAGYYTAPPAQRTSRALKGALIGGLVGVAGGQAATPAGRTQIGQFAQRQAHGLTGYMGKGTGWRGQRFTPRARESLQEARVRALEGMGWNVPKSVQTTGAGRITPTNAAVQKAIADKPTGALSKYVRGGRVDKFLTKQKLRAQAAQRLLVEEGMTSIPGLARGYATKPGMALKANLLAPGAIMGVGLPLAFAAPGVAEGVQQRDVRPVARSLVETAGYALGGGLPMLTAFGVGSGFSAGAGKLFGERPTPAQPAPGTVGALPGRVGAIRRLQGQAGRITPGVVG